MSQKHKKGENKLIAVITGFFAGVLIYSYLPWGLALVAFFLLLALTLVCVYYLSPPDKRELVVIVCVVFCLGLGLGAGRYVWIDRADSLTVPTMATPWQGVIVSEPDVRENNVKYVLEDNEHTRVLLTARTSPTYAYGDELLLSGKIERVTNFATTDGSEFDYVAYLARDEIYYASIYPSIKVIANGEGAWLKARLFSLKNLFIDNVARLIPAPESSLANGLVVGAKESMGKDLLNQFRVAGLIHIVVLSGYNISIIALFTMRLFGLVLSKRTSIVAGVITIILFAILVGGGATVIRASIMAILGLLAVVSGRTSDIIRALIFAGLVMIFINPKLLVFDLGFQLSFLATLGLIYLEPIFKPYFTWLPERVGGLPFREIASATLGAQLTVFPLILYTFGNFSLYAFPVNLLVLPLVPLTMLAVFLTGALSFLSFIPIISFLAYPFAWLAYLLLTYMVRLVSFVSHLPLASLNFPNVPISVIFLMYASLVILILKSNPTNPTSPKTLPPIII